MPFTDKLPLLDRAIPRVNGLLSACSLCGRECGIDRTADKRGYCRAGAGARVASHTLHFGEEPPLVGRGGSGTVFFSHCNLRCVFCQNHQISHGGMGTDITPNELAVMFLDLQRKGAENINLVTPTHFMGPILEALRIAYGNGLKLPIVYNTNGYDSIELLKCLDGIVDIYLPDMKYIDPASSRYCSFSSNYPDGARQAIPEMYRQVGPLVVEGGVARRGLIIRHLVLPNNLSGSYEFLIWAKDAGLFEATIGIMSQYAPHYQAEKFKDLNQRITPREYNEIVEYAVKLGFENILAQEMESSDLFVPDFRKETPFNQTTTEGSEYTE